MRRSQDGSICHGHSTVINSGLVLWDNTSESISSTRTGTVCVITNGYCTTTSATWSPCQQTCGPCGGCDSVQYSSVPERWDVDGRSTSMEHQRHMNRLCSLASAVLMQTNPCSIINRLPSSHSPRPLANSSCCRCLVGAHHG